MKEILITPYDPDPIEWGHVPNELLSGDGWFQIETEYSIGLGLPNRNGIDLVQGFDLVFSPLFKIFRKDTELFKGQIDHFFNVSSGTGKAISFFDLCEISEAVHASFLTRYEEFFINQKANRYKPKYRKENVENVIKETLLAEGWSTAY